MSVVEPGPAATNLFTRVQNILLKPNAEWDVIAGETATPQSLFIPYAVALAAIPAVASFIGMQVFGIGAFWLQLPSAPDWLADQRYRQLRAVAGRRLRYGPDLRRPGAELRQ